jgi:allantoate deiminase
MAEGFWNLKSFMPISSDRINLDIESIAAFTETRGLHDRPTFSRSWRQARDYIAHQAGAAGCAVRIDAAGNLHARHASIPWDRPIWLSGSHIDSVPTGGKYDGVIGVVVPLECLRAAAEEKAVLPLELIVFAEEEGTTFGYGMIGSRLWSGADSAQTVSVFRNKAGQNFFEAGATHGVSADGLAKHRLAAGQYLGLIEVHIEQGPAMWESGESLAVVTAIAGRKQFKAKFISSPNHAGSTPMAYRRDPLVAAAMVITAVDQLAREYPTTVGTVGRIECEPNAINVIPGIVRFTIDLRSPDASVLQVCHQRLDQLVIGAGAPESNFVVTEDQPPIVLDVALCARLLHAAGRPIPETSSGALHDAAILAPILPTAMLFIASKGGISHHPDEFSRIEDITAAAELLHRAIADRDHAKVSVLELNQYGRNAFVAVCGPLFEHSPWIAQHTWAARPFENLHALHEALCQTLYQATQEEQIALIRAHPDLVGKLADQAALTNDSKSEQASAGLTALLPDEVAAFQRYNAAYREKFGFPFVICARENKKAAILEAFPLRLENMREQEISTALREITKIAQLRLLDRVYDAV